MTGTAIRWELAPAYPKDPVVRVALTCPNPDCPRDSLLERPEGAEFGRWTMHRASSGMKTVFCKGRPGKAFSTIYNHFHSNPNPKPNLTSLASFTPLTLTLTLN